MSDTTEHTTHRVHAHDKHTKRQKRLSNAVIFLIFFAVAAAGYVAGTFNNQIFAAIGPIFGIHTYAGTLDLSSLQETYQQLKANYDGKIDDQTLIDGANKGLVSSLGDQYTVYFNKADSQTFDNDLTGNIGGGIGAEISLRNNVPTVVRVLDNNPAKAAGVQAGDVVTKINDESTSGWTVDQTVTKIRGDVGTTIKLEVTRNGETKDFTITRAQVSNPSVVTDIQGSLGIMTVSRFDQDTASEARVAAQTFKNKGVTKIILDLRDNGGGYITAAQALAGLWLDNKVVVTEKANGVVKDQLKSDSNALLAGIPTVVLVNGNTASASEIVSGALHDYKAATLVGEKTFGKGVFQDLINLSGGAELKVTTGKWYTPNGANINQQGITPDKIVDLTDADSNAGKDPQLDAAKQVLGVQ
jgi:carboxyl-terminal processing protease